MAASHVPMARVPFAPLDNPRLQHLASLKNRQRGLLAQKSAALGKAGITKGVFPPKRSYDSTRFNDVDGENIDPEIFSSPAKKSKSDAFGTASAKSFTFSLPSTRSMPPPLSAQPLRFSTPTRTKLTSARSPLTAPAGRSPKRKTTFGRRISAPFSRVDPPSSLGARSGSMLPFSLDAAIHGTLSSGHAPKSFGSTIQESMPGAWFFDIYEDSPEEVAANLMEHSTSILDLSSDDESAQKERDDRGKENMPPEDYDAPTASRSPSEHSIVPRQIKGSGIIRKKVLKVDDMDDGQRSPLSDLETDYFVPDGLDKDAHFVVDAVSEHPILPAINDPCPPPSALGQPQASPEQPEGGDATDDQDGDVTKVDHKDVFSTPVPFVAGDCTKNVDGDEIIVWKDDASDRDVSAESNGETTTA